MNHPGVTTMMSPKPFNGRSVQTQTTIAPTVGLVSGPPAVRALFPHLLPEDVLVDVGGEHGGRGEQGRVHGGHDSCRHGPDADDGDVGGGEVLQGDGQDGAGLAALVGGRAAVAGGVPVWRGKGEARACDESNGGC